MPDTSTIVINRVWRIAETLGMGPRLQWHFVHWNGATHETENLPSTFLPNAEDFASTSDESFSTPTGSRWKNPCLEVVISLDPNGWIRYSGIWRRFHAGGTSSGSNPDIWVPQFLRNQSVHTLAMVIANYSVLGRYSQQRLLRTYYSMDVPLRDLHWLRILSIACWNATPLGWSRWSLHVCDFVIQKRLYPLLLTR